MLALLGAAFQMCLVSFCPCTPNTCVLSTSALSCHTVKDVVRCLCRLWKGLTPLWGRQIPYTMMKFGKHGFLTHIAQAWHSQV